MNVLMLCPHTRISGGVKVIFRIAAGLVHAGINVQLAVYKNLEDYKQWYPYANLPFKIIEGQSLTEKDHNKFDCVITYGDGPLLTHVTTKRVLFLQGFVCSPNKREILTLGTNYDLVITTSRWLYDVAKLVGHNHVKIVAPGIDETFKARSFRPTNRIPIVGTLFHKNPDKQFDLFVNTVNILAKMYNYPVHGMILSAENSIDVKLIRKLNISYSICVNPPQSLINAMYSNCDVWFSPSKNEGFGLTPLEAMTCGVPVVWFPSNGLKKYMNNQNCRIVNSPNDACIAIKEILENPKIYDTLVQNGKELSSKFTWENAIKRFGECLRGI
jgi:glycosyltransferase involved in cell wall biosynthesis